MKLICENCGEELECYEDELRDVVFVEPCQACTDEAFITARGLGYAQGSSEIEEL